MRCACRPPRGRTHYGGLLPLPRSGLRVIRKRLERSRVAVRAHFDANAARQALETAMNAANPSLHLQLADISSHALNFIHSLADEAAVMDTSAGDIADAAGAVTSAVGDAGQAAADAATATNGSGGGGIFEGVAIAFTNFLKVIDSGLELLNVPYSYGFAIILLTVIVKVATFPLTKQQVESSLSMRALQPRMKELQTKYKNDPQRLQQETALLYQEAGVNPLAGCLPTLATIPVFIGLYRALLLAADEGLLKDGFFWIPSLAGPTSISARNAGLGLSWLFPFENGAPPVGWEDAGAYLVLPVLLIISQYISQAIIQQKSDDPSQERVQTVLKLLPLMLGWFSLNVPSGLTLYWITNNILSTGQQVYLKAVGDAPLDSKASTATVVTPRQEVIDVDVEKTGKQLGSRRSDQQIAAAAAADQQKVQRQQQPRRGEKFRARKAQEAARRAANLQAQQGTAQPGTASMTETMLANAPPLDLDAKPPSRSQTTEARAKGNLSAAVEADAIEPPAVVRDAVKVEGEHADTISTADVVSAAPNDVQGVEQDSST